MEKEENLQEQIDNFCQKIFIWNPIQDEKISNSSLFQKRRAKIPDILREFMERELGYHNTRSVEIQRVHRIDQGCNVLGRRLEGSWYQMLRNLPQQIIKRRREQMPTLKKAQHNGLKASSAEVNWINCTLTANSGPRANAWRLQKK